MWSAEKSSEYSVVAGVAAYPGAKQIGTSQELFLQEGVFELGKIDPEDYFYDEKKDAWKIQEGWDYLVVTLALYEDGERIESFEKKIEINPYSNSWLYDTPEAHLISAKYSINNGPDVELDLVFDPANGISVQPGDTIALREVWYKADADGGTHTINVGGHLSFFHGNDTSLPQPIRAGINILLDAESLSWAVQSDDTMWVLWLMRADDGTIFEGIEIPLITETIGD